MGRRYEIPEWLASRKLPAGKAAWDKGWHATLQERFLGGDSDAAVDLILVAAHGAKAYWARPFDSFDEHSRVTEKLLEWIPQWDPARASWVTFVRNRIGWRVKNWREAAVKNSTREPLFEPGSAVFATRTASGVTLGNLTEEARMALSEACS